MIHFVATLIQRKRTGVAVPDPPVLLRNAKRAGLVSGQVIVELMVAMGVLAVGLTGMMALLSQAIGLNRTVADDFTGTYLAAEGIELMKNFVGANFVRQLNGKNISWREGFKDGFSYEVDYLDDTLPAPLFSVSLQTLFYDSRHMYSYDSSATSTSFTREVSVSFIGDDEMKVISRVMWAQRGGETGESKLEDHFYNWVGAETNVAP